MHFQPLTYHPHTLRDRVADIVSRLHHQALNWLAGLPAYSDNQWRFMCTLKRRTVLARHVYFLLATSTDYPRTAVEITTAVNGFRTSAAAEGETNAIELVTEVEVSAALAELYEHGLVDEAYRLRVRIVPV